MLKDKTWLGGPQRYILYIISRGRGKAYLAQGGATMMVRAIWRLGEGWKRLGEGWMRLGEG